MSDLLILARDYIERMSNPVYGLATNEDYSMRLATLLAREGFEDLLIREISELRDRDALSSHGWLWVLGWAKSRRIPLPEGLLLELMDEWSSVFVKSTILEAGTQWSEARVFDRGDTNLENFPDRFLREAMGSAVRERFEPGPEEREPSERVPSMGRSESLLVALLQVGSPITLDAASVLLRHPWPGQPRMLAFFRALYDALEPETRAEWREALYPFPEGLVG